MNTLFIFSYTLILINLLSLFRTKLNMSLKNYLITLGIYLVLLLLFSFHDFHLLPDLPDYIKYFNFIQRTDWIELTNINSKIDIKLDYGFIILTKILSTLVPSPRGYFLILGLLILWPIKKFITENSSLPIFSIFLYFTYLFYENLFLIRQSIALGILLSSIYFLGKNKYLTTILLIGFASTFHQTALIFIPLLLLNLSSNIYRTLAFLGISLIILLPLKEVFIVFGAENLRGYESYVNINFNSSNNTPLLINLSLLTLVLILWLRFKVAYSGMNKVLLNMILISTIIEVGRLGLFGVFGRINMYFMPAFFILLPNLILKIRSLGIKFGISLSLVILFILIQHSNLNYDYNLISWK